MRVFSADWHYLNNSVFVCKCNIVNGLNPEGTQKFDVLKTNMLVRLKNIKFARVMYSSEPCESYEPVGEPCESCESRCESCELWKINKKNSMYMRYIIPYYLLFLTLLRSRTQRMSLSPPRSKGYGECVTSIVLCNLYSIDVSIVTLIMSMDKSCY